MSETYKEQAEDAARKVGDKASEIGHKVAEKAGEAKDWVEEKAHDAACKVEEAVGGACHPDAAPLADSTGPAGSPADIKEHMSVYASCGKFMGKVDHVLGHQIKLTKNDSPDGMHHMIPMAWVARVHDHIHLSQDSHQVENQWKTV